MDNKLLSNSANIKHIYHQWGSQATPKINKGLCHIGRTSSAKLYKLQSVTANYKISVSFITCSIFTVDSNYQKRVLSKHNVKFSSTNNCFKHLNLSFLKHCFVCLVKPHKSNLEVVKSQLCPYASSYSMLVCLWALSHGRVDLIQKLVNSLYIPCIRTNMAALWVITLEKHITRTLCKYSTK